MKNFKTIEAYIRSFPSQVQKELRAIRQTVRRLAPAATEKMAYRIPTFFLKENLVHFAAFRDHISFFPTSSPIRAFKKQLARFKTSRGTIQFPLGKAVPLGLIRKLVRYRLKQVDGLPKRKRSSQTKKKPARKRLRRGSTARHRVR